ncbi:MAG: hypothetical protein QNJ13_01515 [Paracoccaceae bacterium]|nr:hypothetical protein [Paracoccaceae bacterium]
MEEPGLASLKLGAIILTLLGVWGFGMEAERDRSPGRIVMDSQKQACGGMAGFFGCER